MSLQQTLAVLKDMSLFQRVADPRLRVIALMGDKIGLRPGERLAEKGDEGDAAFVILEGRLEIRIPGDEGEVTVAFLGRGEIAGEMAVFTDRPRSAAMVAATETELLRLDRAVLLSLLIEFPDFALEMIRVMADRLEATTVRTL